MKLVIRYWYEKHGRGFWKHDGVEVGTVEDAEEVLTHYPHEVAKAVVKDNGNVVQLV